MKVFLSWSGDVSKSVAESLRDWLPTIIQTVEPWMSSEDIDKGAFWSSNVATTLGEAGAAGIVCVTPDNQAAAWLAAHYLLIVGVPGGLSRNLFSGD